MKTSTVIALGGLGIAAWFLSRRSSAFVPGSGANAMNQPPAKGPGVPDDDHLYPRYCVGAAPTDVDCLMDIQPDPVPYDVEEANLRQAIAMQGASPGWYEKFHKQVELPASRLKISDLWPYHFQLANGLLSGQVSRADQSGNLYKKVLDDIAQNKKDAEDLATANAVISGVAAFIPVIGGVIKLAVGTGLQQGQQGAIANAQNDAAALTALGQIKAGLGQGSPEGKMWLSNRDSNKPPDENYIYDSSGHLTLYTVGLSSMGGYYEGPDGSWAWPDVAGKYVTSTINGVTASRQQLNPGYSFVPVGMRMRLFAMHQYGWVLPWLSPNAGLDYTRDLTTRIAGRAAVYRALDVMSTLGDPIPPPSDGKGYTNRYCYVSPIFGPLLGCTLPPTKEDLYYRDPATNKHYTYDGKDNTAAWTNEVSGYDVTNKSTPPTGATEGTSLVDPNNPATASDIPAPGEDYGHTAPTTIVAEASTLSTPTAGASAPTVPSTPSFSSTLLASRIATLRR